MFRFKKRQIKKIKEISQINAKLPNFILSKFREETMELQKALQFQGMPEIVDEIADVLIMVQQFMNVNGLEKKVSRRIDYKLVRTREFLKDPGYANGIKPRPGKTNIEERR